MHREKSKVTVGILGDIGGSCICIIEYFHVILINNVINLKYYLLKIFSNVWVFKILSITITVNGGREGEKNITIYYMGGWRVQNGQIFSYVINGRPPISFLCFFSICIISRQCFDSDLNSDKRFELLEKFYMAYSILKII